MMYLETLKPAIKTAIEFFKDQKGYENVVVSVKDIHVDTYKTPIFHLSVLDFELVLGFTNWDGKTWYKTVDGTIREHGRMDIYTYTDEDGDFVTIQ